MIQIKDLCKSYDRHVIFSNLNMEIQNDEFIAFTGESGCGKTTLLNMIGAVEPLKFSLTALIFKSGKINSCIFVKR